MQRKFLKSFVLYEAVTHACQKIWFEFFSLEICDTEHGLGQEKSTDVSANMI